MRAVVDVALSGRDYRIELGAGLLAEAGGLIAPMLARPRLAVITEARVAAAHLDRLRGALSASGIEVEVLTLQPGEATKSWDCLQRSVEWLLSLRVERNDLVVAFGGGVIGDLAGFAAAILRRGVGLIQIPTSLLAQVDSAVGGKTGINSAQGKNLIGAFHQPRLVIADTTLPDTLPRRDLLAGYAEVAKYGLLGDVEFFTWLEANAARLLAGDQAARLKAVHRSCEMKADFVRRDETEQGERALLNLGHTFGHALEGATGYSERLLHGEGVSIGCTLAFALSARLGLCSQELPGRVAAHFESLGMRHSLDQIPGDLPDGGGLMDLMAQDKKVRDGRLTFVLARAIGEAFVTQEVPGGAVLSLLDDELGRRSRPA